MRNTYNKLVRNRIPEHLAEKGITFETSVVLGGAFETALLDKLQEEAHEVVTSALDGRLQELADVQEVLDELAHLHGFTQQEVRAAQNRKREARGGFSGRILLHWLEEPQVPDASV